MTTPSTRLYPAGGHQLTLNLVQDGQEAAIVLGAVTRPERFLVAADFAAWRDAAWGAFRSLCQTGTSCAGATGRLVMRASGSVVELGPPPSPGGALTGAVGLASGSTLIKWGTAEGGRSGKGRTFIPGLPISSVAAGGRTYSSAHQTAIATAVSSYLGAALWTGGLSPAVLSFTKGQAHVITSGAASPIVGLQRRRMR